jgi:hypothetical protein
VSQPSHYSYKPTPANLELIAPKFRFPFVNHQACIARCARNGITTPKIVITSKNLAVADVGDSDMALASVGNSDDEVDKKQQESTEKPMQSLAGATNPEELVLVSSGAIDNIR